MQDPVKHVLNALRAIRLGRAIIDSMNEQKAVADGEFVVLSAVSKKARPPMEAMISFVDAYREKHGVESICRVIEIAPSTYHAYAARGRKRRQRRCVAMQSWAGRSAACSMRTFRSTACQAGSTPQP